MIVASFDQTSKGSTRGSRRQLLVDAEIPSSCLTNRFRLFSDPAVPASFRLILRSGGNDVPSRLEYSCGPDENDTGNDAYSTKVDSRSFRRAREFLAGGRGSSSEIGSTRTAGSSSRLEQPPRAAASAIVQRVRRVQRRTFIRDDFRHVFPANHSLPLSASFPLPVFDSTASSHIRKRRSSVRPGVFLAVSSILFCSGSRGISRNSATEREPRTCSTNVSVLFVSSFRRSTILPSIVPLPRPPLTSIFFHKSARTGRDELSMKNTRTSGRKAPAAFHKTIRSNKQGGEGGPRVQFHLDQAPTILRD